jgi:hypothetical protein
LPRKGGKDGSGKVTWSRWVGSMKGVNELLGVSKVSSRFPAIMTKIIAFPFDQVLVLVAILTTIQDVFDFIFKLVFNLDWLWRWWCVPINFVTKPRRKVVDMKDWVLVHGWREKESVDKVTCTFSNIVGAKLLWG